MKSVIVHGALALLGLVLSYQTWTRKEDQETPAGEVVIAECDPSKLGTLEMETPNHLVTVAPKQVGTDIEYWVTSLHKKEEKKPDVSPEVKKEEPPAFDATLPPADDKNAKKDAKEKNAKDAKAAKDAQDKDAKDKDAKDKDATAAKDAEKKPEDKQPRPYDPDAPVTFLASAQFATFVKGLAPLRAIRGLGDIPKDKLAQFGFDKGGTYLRMQCGGQKIALDVGGKTFGGSDSYVRDAKTKQYYLFSGQTLMDLESAQFKYMQTDLTKVAQSDADEAVIKAKGRERRLLHRNRLVKEEAIWVDAAAKDKRNELFETWFQRLDKLKVKSFLDAGKEPGSDLQIEASAPQPVLSLQYKLEGKPQDTLEVVRVDTKKGNFYYARSQATQRWVTLYDSLAKQVDDDVALVVGIEEAPLQSLPESEQPAKAGATGAPTPAAQAAAGSSKPAAQAAAGSSKPAAQAPAAKPAGHP
jgi:hypothetical protein